MSSPAIVAINNPICSSDRPRVDFSCVAGTGQNRYGTTFDLVEGWDSLLPHRDREDRTSRAAPYWQQLMAEYEARGSGCGRTHCGHSASGYGIVKDDTLIAAAMGHTEVHHRSYRTSEWRSVRKAFAEAS